MAWIESHQGLARHIKTKRFARKLGVTVPTAVGHLHLLWWWALDNLPDGNLSLMEPEDIADEMMWNDEPKTLITALIDSGFADEYDGSLFIHDWHDYIGRLLERRKKETDRKREYRKKSEETQSDIPPPSQGCPTGQDVEVPSDGGGNSTVPYLTKDLKHMFIAQFEELWTLYPKKVGKEKAKEHWVKKIVPILEKGTTSIGDILKGTRAYIDYCKNTERFLKDGSAFVNQKTWNDFLDGSPEVEAKSSFKKTNKNVIEIPLVSGEDGDHLAEMARRQAERNLSRVNNN